MAPAEQHPTVTSASGSGDTTVTNLCSSGSELLLYRQFQKQPSTHGANMIQKIKPFLWFDGRAEEAANFYTGIFKNSRVLNVSRYGDAGPGPKGSAMSVTFELEGQTFLALNGGPMFTFTPAISFLINCETQAEVDDLWTRLSEGGEKSRCGWLKDKFGLSWQVVPSILGTLLQSKDTGKAGRVMEAMMTMDKLDIARLEKAAEPA